MVYALYKAYKPIYIYIYIYIYTFVIRDVICIYRVMVYALYKATTGLTFHNFVPAKTADTSAAALLASPFFFSKVSPVLYWLITEL